jgi:AcrR family transcriptional regulator
MMARNKQATEACQGTEKRIIKAASDVFSREGYRGATTKRIAEAAGINEITLFRRFKSKENVLRRVLEDKGTAIMKIMESTLIMKKDADVIDCLQGLSTLASVLVTKEWELIMPLMEHRDIRPLIAEYMFSTVRSITARLNRFFEFHIEAGNLRNVNPEVATAIFFGYLVSPVNRTKAVGVNGTKEDSKRAFQDFIDIFAGGISRDDKKKVNR